MRKRTKHLLPLLLCAALLACAVPVRAAPLSDTGFTDVARGDWYEENLLKLVKYWNGIIDGVTDTTFEPERSVKRGEFLKMVMTAAEGYTADKSRNGIHWAGEYYTIALENNILVATAFTEESSAGTAAGASSGGVRQMFPCTFDALEQPIPRYEMAVILSNTCANMLMETAVSTAEAYDYISDYGNISSQYVTAVEQSYGKGILNGYSDGSFGGSRSLRRCEAAAVIYRMLYTNDREMPDWATQPEVPTAGPTEYKGYKSFALWLQSGHIDAWGHLDNEAKAALFGEGTAAYNRGYFASSAEAAPYMTSVSIPFWTLNSAGQKVESAGYITVHKLLAAEVQAIFQQIFDDPEHFPIYGHSVGGARFSDAMRHAWGCAIDINPYYNCECNFKSGALKVTCGYGWYPFGMDGQTWMNRSTAAYHGTLTEASYYSISPYGSVVRAFADYGWGWGGSGSNVVGQGTGWSSGNSFDFMHFSILPSGG